MERQRILKISLLLWIVLIFILCCMPLPESNAPNLELIPHLDKIVHWGLFLFLGKLLYAYLKNTISFPIILTLLFVAFYGALIEWLQGTYFSRTADFWDWVADVLGGITGILLYPFIYKMIIKLSNRKYL